MQQSIKLHRLIAIFTLIVVLLIVGTIYIKSKGILIETEKSDLSELKEVKVTILTSGSLTDQSWGSLAYKGKLEIEDLFPVDVSLYSELTSNELITNKVNEAIKNGAELIIGQGREFTQVFSDLARVNSSVNFVTIHGSLTYENQAVYTFDQGEIEYFAALSAALVTKTNKVAIIDTKDDRKANSEFEDALEYYKPESTFYYDFVGDRENGEKALKILQQLIEEGVDVVYSKGNSFNRDVIDYAKRENIYVIGYLDDQSYMAKEHVITSVLNDVPKAYTAIMNDYFSEDGIPLGQVVMLDENDGVYKLAPFGPMLSETDKKYIANEMEKYRNGVLLFR
ncbi:BMP family ABC transporter substrate-binding protein [Metabacillus malikii]|uniref:Transcriptional activator of comK protein n=1 Tax=Metabacillus malikii TaxID=1504265 RepID=A0ABT9ZGI3_9BACI|nr:BMP family ABC transporter substrate-binding protein [Metabacillus malikii]MDQ0230360.1 transcriptional activator of comK gene [Metabacillus malikii]